MRDLLLKELLCYDSKLHTKLNLGASIDNLKEYALGSNEKEYM